MNSQKHWALLGTAYGFQEEMYSEVLQANGWTGFGQALGQVAYMVYSISKHCEILSDLIQIM